MSLLAPLRVPQFRDFWIGMSLSTTGYWMQMIAVIWIMKSWSDGDVILISWVQTAIFFPVMLFAIPAGVMSDRIDRRKLLIGAHLLMMMSPLLIFALSSLHVQSPWALLALTALFATGYAVKLPSQSAMIPDLIDRGDLVAALGLNSIAVNGGRIIGPGFAGLLSPMMGAVNLLLINAASYLAFVGVLLRMKPLPRKMKQSTSIATDIQTIFKFLIDQPKYAATLIRGGLFFLSWPIIMIVLPLLAADTATFGIVYSFFGVGAILGALLVQKLRRYFNSTSTLLLAVIIHAVSIGVISAFKTPLAMSAVVLCIGVSSFLGMNALQISAQSILPADLRGRGLSLMNMVLMGTSALSSPVWGLAITKMGMATSCLLAALLSLFTAAVTQRMKLADTL